MIPHVGEMALDRVASHCAEKLYSYSSLTLKEEIAKALLEREKELGESFSGRIVMKNCKVKEYGEEREKWTEKQNQSLRRKEMFKELLEEVGTQLFWFFQICLFSFDFFDFFLSIRTQHLLKRRESASQKRSKNYWRATRKSRKLILKSK
jgi:hypothetical protein